jgi:hypothetical protein
MLYVVQLISKFIHENTLIVFFFFLGSNLCGRIVKILFSCTLKLGGGARFTFFW